ncbi:hypothetical protein T492DRAFT_198853 [Pavlovales sp. CCMP2436]|nr:hypothetical protein T492DRAFT_198853 [Pavlovales sp. CCMP2436]
MTLEGQRIVCLVRGGAVRCNHNNSHCYEQRFDSNDGYNCRYYNYAARPQQGRASGLGRQARARGGRRLRRVARRRGISRARAPNAGARARARSLSRFEHRAHPSLRQGAEAAARRGGRAGRAGQAAAADAQPQAQRAWRAAPHPPRADPHTCGGRGGERAGRVRGGLSGRSVLATQGCTARIRASVGSHVPVTLTGLADGTVPRLY